MCCKKYLKLLACIVFLFSSVFTKGSAAEHVSDVLYFSMVPKKNIDQQIQELSPLLDLLEKRLKKSIQIIRPSSYHSVIEGILSNTIDFAILGPASYAKARARDTRVEAFASFARKKGFITPRGSYYFSVLLALKKNGFDSVKELRQKKVALTDPESTSGAVIPNMAFSNDIGQPLKDYFGTIVFTGSHDRSINSILRGHVDAAFVSSVRLDEAVKKKRLAPDQVVVLWQSDPIHHDPFVFSGEMKEPLRNQIRKIMFSSAPSLNSMLKSMNMAGIVAVSDKDYQAIHKIVSMQSKER